MVGLDARALEQARIEIALGRRVLRVEMEVLAVLEAAAGEEDGQIFRGVAAGAAGIAAGENGRATGRLESSSFDWRILGRRSRAVFMASIPTILSSAGLPGFLPWRDRA